MTLRQFLATLQNETSIVVIDDTQKEVANFLSTTYESIVAEYLDQTVTKVDVATNATGLKCITVTITE